MCNGVDLRLGVAGAGRRAAKEAPEVSMCHIEEHRGFAALQPRPPRRESRVFATFAEGTAKTSPVGFTSNGVDLRLGVAGAGRSAAKEAPEVSMCHIEEHRGFAALQPRPPRRTRRMGLKGCLLPALHLGSSIRTSRMASQRMLKSTPLGFMPMERGFDDCDTFSLTNFLLHRCKAG